MMSSIYDEHKDEDGFLYFTYSGENTFGDVINCQKYWAYCWSVVDMPAHN